MRTWCVVSILPLFFVFPPYSLPPLCVPVYCPVLEKLLKISSFNSKIWFHFILHYKL